MSYSEESRRPSLVSKPTHVRYQKHHATHPPDLPASPRTLDHLIVGFGYVGLAGYLWHNFRRFTPWEVAGLSIGSLAWGYGLFDLGRRTGTIQGASFALRSGDDNHGTIGTGGEIDIDDDSWKGKFRGKEFEDLKTGEKIAWLRQEQQRIRDLQEDEQLRCGQAYIAKEEAYKAYEKRGGYGGPHWKVYADADGECRSMYQMYEGQLKRLSEIRQEIDELSQQI